jgi:hypothetical protein
VAASTAVDEAQEARKDGQNSSATRSLRTMKEGLCLEALDLHCHRRRGRHYGRRGSRKLWRFPVNRADLVIRISRYSKVPLKHKRFEVTAADGKRISVKIRRGRRWDQRRRFPGAPLHANNPLVPVDLSSTKNRRPLGFSGHPCRRNN